MDRSAATTMVTSSWKRRARLRRAAIRQAQKSALCIYSLVPRRAPAVPIKLLELLEGWPDLESEAESFFSATSLEPAGPASVPEASRALPVDVPSVVQPSAWRARATTESLTVHSIRVHRAMEGAVVDLRADTDRLPEPLIAEPFVLALTDAVTPGLPAPHLPPPPRREGGLCTRGHELRRLPVESLPFFCRCNRRC